MQNNVLASTFVLVALLSLAAPINALVQAQQPNWQLQKTYWHTSDYYSIDLNGVGNAFVSSEFDLQSLTNIPVNTITLQIPYPGVTVYQLISENTSHYPCLGCVQPAYYYANAQFVKYNATQTFNSTTLTLFLNQPLVNSSQVTLYLFFSTPNPR